jgi:hypothetical protein
MNYAQSTTKIKDNLIEPGNEIIKLLIIGIYFIPFYLSQLEKDKNSIGKYINWTLVSGFSNIGGVRIEDIVAIGLDGETIIM